MSRLYTSILLHLYQYKSIDNNIDTGVAFLEIVEDVAELFIYLGLTGIYIYSIMIYIQYFYFHDYLTLKKYVLSQNQPLLLGLYLFK